MTRRLFLTVPAAAQAVAAIRKPQRAQHERFPGVEYRDYSRCLPSVLRGLAAASYRLREAEIAKLTTPAAIRARQRWTRETFWKLVGGEPERTPLNTRNTDSFERDGYRLEKLVYESQPGLHVTANLYVPTTGKPPYPGVLFQMGHSPNGKAYPNYQRCCQGLVRLGFLVLAFDPMGQGERVYYPLPRGTRSRLPSVDDEHTRAGSQMLLVGDTATRMQVWDAVRSLDHLASHPLVDPKRLGSTGQSGGGTLTMLLSCVDDRLAAAAVMSGNTENFACADFDSPGSVDDAEQDFLGAGPLGFDRWDLLYPLAPKPLLVHVSDKDWFGTYSPNYIANGWQEYLKLKRVYERLGAPEKLAWGDTPLPHGLSYDSRLNVYNFFSRWLKNETARIEAEPPVNPEPEKNVLVTESGNTLYAFKGNSPFLMARARKLQKTPMPLDRLLSLDRPPANTRATVLRSVPSRGMRIEAIEIPSAPGVWLPAWLFIPERPDVTRPAFLLLEPSGRNTRWGEGALYQTLAASGSPVCVPDLRGIGDLFPALGRDGIYDKGHNDEENYAWACLMLGKSLLGMRVADILAAAIAFRAHPAGVNRKLVIGAQGKMTVPALFAAALDPEIVELYLADGLATYRSLVDVENYSHPFANFIPNVLAHTDLPEVAASLAPRRVILAGPVDGLGRPLDPARARELYPGAANVEFQPSPRWEAEAFLF